MKKQTKGAVKGPVKTDPLREEQQKVDGSLDKREVARQTQKPRSPRESLKGPSNRKGPAARMK